MGMRAFTLSGAVSRRLVLCLAVLAAALGSVAAAGEEIYEAFRPGSVLEHVTDLDRCHIAVLEGSTQAEAVKARVKRYELVPCRDTAAQVAAVLEGRAQAAIFPLPVAENLAHANPKLRVMPELLDSADYAFAFRHYSGDLKKAADAAITAMQADGTLAEMSNRWVGLPADKRGMPDISVRPDTLPLRVGTAPVLEPYSYLNDKGEPIGFDIELARRVAHEAKMNFIVTTMEYAQLFPALKNGDIDVIAACLEIAPSRADDVLFSEPYAHGGTAILTLAREKKADEPAGE